MITVQAGATLTITEVFLDDFNIPLIPSSNPVVELIDSGGELAFFSSASPDIVPGTWIANITVPKSDNRETIEYTVVWKFISGTDTYKSKEAIQVEPSVQIRQTESVCLFGDTSFVVNLPIVIDPSTPTVTSSLYEENTLLFTVPHTDASVSISVNKYTTNLVLPLSSVLTASIYPRTLLVNYKSLGALIPETLTYKVWVVTPSILNTASQLENFVNKSRVSNVILELQYAQSDLMLALLRGLEMFNTIGSTLTTFSGLNMQGPFQESWIICSAIALLNAQYLAEGSLAFDFSGQSVNLNIDRTQYLDSMIGKLESRVTDQVLPFKKLLAKSGIVSGDGSAGNKSMQGTIGIVTVTQAPTTRIWGRNTNFKHYW